MNPSELELLQKLASNLSTISSEMVAIRKTQVELLESMKSMADRFGKKLDEDFIGGLKQLNDGVKEMVTVVQANGTATVHAAHHFGDAAARAIATAGKGRGKH